MLLAGVAFALWRFNAAPLPQPPATARIQTLDGRDFTLAQTRGQPVLLNFWSTSCSVCLREMPRLAATHRRLAARGLQTIAVAMSYDPPMQVRDYATRQALPFTVAFDPLGALARAFAPVDYTPTTFVLDREGRVVQRYLGEPDFEALEALIERLLMSPDRPAT